MSFFYKLDARTKLVFVLMLTLLVFLVDKFPAALLLPASAAAVRLSARIPSSGINSLKSFTLLAAFIILTQTIFGPGQYFMTQLGAVVPIKREGFFLGLVIVCRLAALVVLLPVFTQTTPPASIACGLYSLGFSGKTAFIISFTFNLIPGFREEARSIMDAQMLRGVKRFTIRSFAALAAPLMLGAMRKAQASSIAMDCRAFCAYKTRTWTKLPRMTKADFLFIMACTVFCVCLLFLNYY